MVSRKERYNIIITICSTTSLMYREPIYRGRQLRSIWSYQTLSHGSHRCAYFRNPRRALPFVMTRQHEKYFNGQSYSPTVLSHRAAVLQLLPTNHAFLGYSEYTPSKPLTSPPRPFSPHSAYPSVVELQACNVFILTQISIRRSWKGVRRRRWRSLLLSKYGR